VADDNQDGTPWAEVARVLGALGTAACRVWVAGGWGVDTLVGRQTRPHRDLDLAVHADDEAAVVVVLEHLGYRVATDWRPVRVELVAPGRGRVDLHPVAFDARGHGHQADHDGGHFAYPRAAFAVATLHGVVVPCLSAEQQVRFHQGYEPREVDLHDLGLLADLADPPVPS